jgi:hypothetical protein
MKVLVGMKYLSGNKNGVQRKSLVSTNASMCHILHIGEVTLIFSVSYYKLKRRIKKRSHALNQTRTEYRIPNLASWIEDSNFPSLASTCQKPSKTRTYCIPFGDKYRMTHMPPLFLQKYLDFPHFS